MPNIIDIISGIMIFSIFLLFSAADGLIQTICSTICGVFLCTCAMANIRESIKESKNDIK